MTKPDQQHYLAQTYLKFFQVPQKPGFVFFYQRAQKPVLVNIKKVARERHLYTFPSETGESSFELEKMLSLIESEVAPLLERLNSVADSFSMTAEEKGTLSLFLAFQAVRTPAQLGTLRKAYADMAKVISQLHASHKEIFHQTVRSARKSGLNLPDDFEKIEQVRKFALEGEYDVEVDESPFLLGQAVELAFEALYPCILHKDPVMLRSQETGFITSDHPVALVPRQRSHPFYGSGFANSDLFFPIGSEAALYFVTNSDQAPPEDPKENIAIPVLKPRGFEVRQYNGLTIRNAENYLFAAENNPSLWKLFRETTRPERFKLSNPFEKRRKEAKPANR